MGSFRAELLLLRRRPATWLLGVVAVLLALFFTYVLPYATYAGGSDEPSFVTADLADLVPASFVSSTLAGFPFYMGMFALILGVLAFGSEYGWNTLKTALSFQPSRGRLVAAKLASIAVVTLMYAVAILAAAALASSVIAWREGAAFAWPTVGTVVRGIGAGWLLLTLWALFGAVLAVLFRGTPIAVGLGIVWGLVVEGLISGFRNDVAVLGDLALAFIRTNGNSLLQPLGVTVEGEAGPGAFSGPFVGAWQALIVIASYVVAFSAISTLLLRHRDVA